ncbi:MAG: OmpH family outer membrane protein [Armatimonadetes bacterium]|nr:OmpH family outer membrane protein [Armatimonadota bacterium]
MFNRIPVAAATMTLGAALMIAPVSRPARAADAAQRVAVAVVSMNRVMNEAKPVANLDAEFKATLADQQKQLNNLFAGRLLDDKERAELETLQKLAAPNANQTRRIAELSKVSDTRQTELERLSRLERPNDTERARKTELENYLNKQNQRVMQLQQSLGQARDKKQQEIYQRALDSVMTVVRAVAKERGIELVVDRNSVLFSSDDRDITDVILQRLNSGAAAAPARPAPKK